MTEKIFRIPVEYVIFRNSGDPLVMMPGSAYAWPGACLTSSTFQLRFDLLEDTELFYARWVLAWTPEDKGGVRLVHMDDGPTNITEISKFEVEEYYTPKVSVDVITTELRDLLTGETKKHIGIQGYGEAKVYASYIETLWEILRD